MSRFQIHDGATVSTKDARRLAIQAALREQRKAAIAATIADREQPFDAGEQLANMLRDRGSQPTDPSTSYDPTPRPNVRMSGDPAHPFQVETRDQLAHRNYAQVRDQFQQANGRDPSMEEDQALRRAAGFPAYMGVYGAAAPVTDPRGDNAGILRSMSREAIAGFKEAKGYGGLVDTMAGAADGDSVSELANVYRNRRLRPISPGSQAVNDAPTLGALARLSVEHPGLFIQGVGDVTARSYGQVVPGLFAQMAAGAAAGPVGYVAANAANSFGIEYANSWIDALEEAIGPDAVQDENALSAALSDPRVMGFVNERATARAAAISTMDTGASAGMSLIMPTTPTRGLARAVGRFGLQTGVGMTGESAGEAAAQFSAGQPIDPKEVALEGLAGIGEAVTEAATITAEQTKRAFEQRREAKSVSGNAETTGMAGNAQDPVNQGAPSIPESAGRSGIPESVPPLDPATLPPAARAAYERSQRRAAIDAIVEEEQGTQEQPKAKSELDALLERDTSAQTDPQTAQSRSDTAPTSSEWDNIDAMANRLIREEPEQRRRRTLLEPLGITVGTDSDPNAPETIAQDAKLLGKPPVVFDSREQERAWTDAKQFAERRELVRIANGNRESATPPDVAGNPKTQEVPNEEGNQEGRQEGLLKQQAAAPGVSTPPSAPLTTPGAASPSERGAGDAPSSATDAGTPAAEPATPPAESGRIGSRGVSNTRENDDENTYYGIDIRTPVKDLTDEQFARITQSAGTEFHRRNIEMAKLVKDPRFLRHIQPGEIGYQPTLSNTPERQPVTADYKAIREFARTGKYPERGQRVNKVRDLFVDIANRVGMDGWKDTPEARERMVRTADGILRAAETGIYNDFMHPDNRISRAVFSRITGQKLPVGVAKTKAFFKGTPFATTLGDATRATERTERAEKPEKAETQRGPKKAPPKPEQTYTKIGTNKDGHPLYQDQRGVRSILRDGVRVFEPVRLNGAGQMVGVNRGDEFLTEQERETTTNKGEPASPKDEGEGAASKASKLRAQIKSLEESTIPALLGRAPFDPAMGQRAIAAATDLQTKRAQLAKLEGAPKIDHISSPGVAVQWFNPGDYVVVGDSNELSVVSKTHPEGALTVTTPMNWVDKGEQAGGTRIRLQVNAKNVRAIGRISPLKIIDLVPGPAPTPAPAAGFLSNLSAEKQARAEELKKRLQAKLNNELRAGFDPEMFAIGAELTALYVESGVKRFGDFARRMVADIGPAVKPYLRAFYNGARSMPGVDTTGMDDAATVEQTDVEAMLKEPADETVDDQGAEQGRGESGSGPGLQDRGEAPSGAPGAAGAPAGNAGEAADGASPGGDAVSGGGLRSGGKRGGGRSGGRARSGRGARKPGSEPAVDANGGDVEPGQRGSDDPAPRLDQDRPKDVSSLNHRIAAGDVIAPKGVVGKIRANIEALELLKRLEAESRNATPAEKKILARYTAWGGLASALDSIKGERWKEWLETQADPSISDYMKRYSEPDTETKAWADKWYDHYVKIRELMTREEFRDAQETTQYAHYTSASVISKAIWPIAQRLGFAGGNVLETSAGVGHFIGLMPEQIVKDSRWVAVEKDSIPSRILAKLYPEATVLAEPFEQAKLKAASFDLIVGNVPFAARGPSDKRYPKFNLHNYFLARSIDLLRPGGLMAVITSRSTMDEPGSSSEFREWAAGRADLIGAIRLPNSAFMENAGTKVTTDILIFRKRDGASMTLGQDWTSLRDIEVRNTTTGKQATTAVNEYFHANPSMMLGELVVGRGLYSDQEPMLIPREGADMEKQIAEAIDRLPTDIAIEGAKEAIRIESGTEGSFDLDEQGKPFQIIDSARKYVGKADAAVVSAFVGLRKGTLDLYRQQIDPEASDQAIEQARVKIAKQYRAFVKAHGRINENADVLSDDPDFYRVAALEIRNRSVERKEVRGKVRYVYNYTYSDSDVLTKRTQYPTIEPTSADNIDDALAISEAWKGGFDVEYVASLLKQTPEQVKADMLDRGLAFLDPASGVFVPEAEYLSGNLRKKLDVAEAANDPSFQRNIDALKAALPARVPLPSVTFALGAQWIPPKVYEDFAKEYIGAKVIDVGRAGEAAGNQLVASPNHRANSVQDEQKGAGGLSASEILASTINLQPVRVMKRVPNPNNKSGYSEVVDGEATAAAKFAATQMDQAFQSWAKGSEHALELENLYNESFNSSVARKWPVPAIERFPGASPLVTLLPHQRRAVFRGLRESYLNANEVGTGKTYIFISTAMEMRRLGLARKPLIVAQNSTIGQVADSFARLYPSARVLVPSKKDLETKNRKRLINLIASNDWDAVILPQSQFNMLPDRRERTSNYILDQIDALEDAIRDEGGDPDKAGRSSDPKVKAMGKRLSTLRDFYQKLMDRKIETQAGTFEDLGVDALLVDEAHAYKKLAFITNLDNVKGLDTAFSQRGLTLFMKARWVQERRGGRNVILFTGTPITNTLAEAWTMARYVRPKLLEDNGIDAFDQFVTTFAVRSTEYELVAGVKLKEVERLRAFGNIPEFQRLWGQIADEVRAADVGIKRPPIKGGGRDVRIIEPSGELKSYMRELLAEYEWFEGLQGKERYENRHVPGRVNMLARAAAVDLRLVKADAKDDAKSKLNTIVDEVYRIWKGTEEQGLTQAVIIDRFQRGDGGFNVFHDMRDKLVKMGVPADQIGIVTDPQYDDPDKRGPLFEAVNNRSVRIIMGTTERLGVGVNIQKYLVALHHGDVPARPADMEQREGRINRQGNLTHQDFAIEPEIIAYGVKQTFDAGGYERLSRKQKMQDDARNGKFVGRVIEDDADDVLNYAEAAANLTGDPDFKKRAELTAKVRELEAAQESFQSLIINARRRIDTLSTDTIPSKEKAIETLESQREDAKKAQTSPVMELRGQTAEGEEAILEHLKKFIEDAEPEMVRRREQQGTINFDAKGPALTVNGIEFQTWARASRDRESGKTTVGYSVKHPHLYLGWGDVTTARGIWDRIREGLKDLPSRVDALNAELDKARADLAEAEKFVQTKFANEDDLKQARADLQAIITRLANKQNAQHHGDTDVQTLILGGLGVGPVSTGKPSAPQRFSERVVSVFNDYEQRAKERRRERAWRMGGSMMLYTGVIPDPKRVAEAAGELADLVIIATARAVRANLREGRPLTKLVDETIAAVNPSAAPKAKQIRGWVAKLLANPDATEEGFDRLVSDLSRPFRTKGEARAAKRAAAAARKAKVADLTAEKPGNPVTVDAKEALATSLEQQAKAAGKVQNQAAGAIRTAIVRSFKAGTREGWAQAGVEIGALRGQLKAAKDWADVLQAMGKRTTKNAVKDHEAAMQELRGTLVEAAKKMPPKVAKKHLARIVKVKTKKQAAKAMVAMERTFLKLQIASITRETIKRTNPAKMKKMKGSTKEFRNAVGKIRNEAGGLRTLARDKNTKEIAQLQQMLETATEQYEQAMLHITTARAAHQAIREMQGLTAWQIAGRVAERIAKRGKSLGRDGHEDPKVGDVKVYVGGITDLENILHALEGPSGDLKRLLIDRPRQSQNKIGLMQRDFDDAMDRAAKRAGFANANEAWNAWASSAGRGVVKRVGLKAAGGQDFKVTLGDIGGLLGAFSDPETRATFAHPDGRQIQTEYGRSTTPINISPAEIEAAMREHDPDGKIMGFIKDAKAWMERYAPEAFRQVYLAKGVEPVHVKDYWPRTVNLAATGAAKELETLVSAGDFMSFYAQNQGIFHTRTKSRAPLVTVNPVTTWMNQAHDLTTAIAMTMPIRDAAMVLFDPRVKEAIVDKIGADRYRQMVNMLAATSEVQKVYEKPSAKWVAGGAQAAAIMALGSNLGSWLANLSGAVRFLPFMPSAALAAGIAHVTTHPAESMATLFDNGYFYRRYTKTNVARHTNLLVNPADANIEQNTLPEIERALKNIAVGDWRAAYSHIRKASARFLEIMGWIESRAALVAYHGWKWQLGRKHKDWSARKVHLTALRKAERLIRETQNPSEVTDAAPSVIENRGTVLAPLAWMQGDKFKTYARIQRGFNRSTSQGVKVLAAEALSAAIINAGKKRIWLLISLIAAMAAGDGSEERRIKKEMADFESDGLDTLRDVVAARMPLTGSMTGSFIAALIDPKRRQAKYLFDAPGVPAIETLSRAGKSSWDAIWTMFEASGRRSKRDDALVALLTAINDITGAGGVNPFHSITSRVLNQLKKAAQ